jgi:aminopeptidase N
MKTKLAFGAFLAGMLAFFLAPTMPHAAADTYPRQPAVDAIHYTFRVTLRDDSDEISGETTAQINFLKDGLTEFALDLASAANGKGMTVTAVTLEGKPVQHVHEKNRLRISLDPVSHAGERPQFEVTYQATPASGLHIGPNKYGERTFFSENWPDKARQWLPVSPI